MFFSFSFSLMLRGETRTQESASAVPQSQDCLLSTVNTLEALGLEIHQCVVSSFNDFSLQVQASCSEVSKLYYCMFGLISNLAELHCVTVILLKPMLLSFKYMFDFTAVKLIPKGY